MHRILRVFAVFLALFVSLPSQAVTEIYLRSESGDYIGQGRTYDFLPQNGNIIANPVLTNDGKVRGVSLYTFNSVYGYWSFNLVGTSSQTLIPDNYESATRYPFNSPTKPGLDASGSGRGCNRLTGRFIVREANFGPNNEVINFAADFEQHCEGSTPALFGHIRINSDIPMIVTTPNAAAGADKHVDEGDSVTLDGSKSAVNGGNIVNYQWTQLSGPAVNIINSNAATAQFTAPSVPEGGSELRFQLSVTDDKSQSATDMVTIYVANQYDPHTLIYFDSQSGDYIGQGKKQTLTIDDGLFRAQKNFQNGVTVNFTGDAYWTTDFAAANNIPLAQGTFENAIRFPFNSGVNGLSISGDGRGCNTLTGRFEVRSVVFKPLTSDVDSFAADFEQHCEGGSPALFGTVLYNYRKPRPVTALNISSSIAEDTSGAILLSAIGGSGTYSYQLLSNPSNGNVSGTPPDLVYTPNSNYFGTDSFTYRVNDGKNDSNVATVTIAVQAVNDPPVATGQTLSTNEDQALPISLSATDIDNGTLQYTIVTPPANGVLSGSAPNLVYTPTANYNGSDSFTFKANDGLADSNIATINVAIAPVNDSPIAKNDSATTKRNRAVTIPVLANDVDVEGNSLTITSVSKPRYGSVSITSDKKQVKFTPKEGFVGTVTFTYSVSDGNGGTGTATVTVTVTRS